MRINSGKYRGKRLVTGKGQDIRPTSDMVKQAIFNVLQTKAENENVLDLFCGSGALGIEALSRGSKIAVFNDNSRESIGKLRQNLQNAGVPEQDVQIYCMDYMALCNMLSGSGRKFDIIFIDPPYQGDTGKRAVSACAALAAKGGVIVHEYQQQAGSLQYSDIPEHTIVTKRYGNTAVDFIYI